MSFTFFQNIFIGILLIYNVVLISGVQQNEPVTHIFFKDSFPIYVITKYWVEFPMVCKKSLLIIYFIYTGSPMDCKEIHPIHSKGDQSWDFFGRNDAKTKTPVLWPPHAKSWLIGKDSDAARDWGQEKKGTMEDEMAGWHHRLNGRGFGWTPGVGETGRPGVLRFMGLQRLRHDWATDLNWTELTREGVRILEVTAAFAWQSNKATLSFSSLTLVSVFLFGISVQRAKILAILLTISGWIWILGTLNQMPYIKFKNM